MKQVRFSLPDLRTQQSLSFRCGPLQPRDIRVLHGREHQYADSPHCWSLQYKTLYQWFPPPGWRCYHGPTYPRQVWEITPHASVTSHRPKERVRSPFLKARLQPKHIINRTYTRYSRCWKCSQFCHTYSSHLHKILTYICRSCFRRTEIFLLWHFPSVLELWVPGKQILCLMISFKWKSFCSRYGGGPACKSLWMNLLTLLSNRSCIFYYMSCNRVWKHRGFFTCWIFQRFVIWKAILPWKTAIQVVDLGLCVATICCFETLLRCVIETKSCQKLVSKFSVCFS
jgi:hypothetical protein